MCLLLLLTGAEPAATTSTITREQDVDQLFEYLVNEYSKRQLTSKDWITRSVATISIAQIPRANATKTILDRLGKETHPVGRLVAWQAVLSRANLLTESQLAQWQQATAKMMRESLFQGDLRVSLLEMLSSTPITRENRQFVRSLFEKTNSLDATDVPTLVAMGRAIRAWGDADLIENLLAVTSMKDHFVRAKLVLKAAGADLPLDADASAFTKWWKDAKAEFVKKKPAADDWKSLHPQFIDPPVDAKKVDPEEKKWRQQLELGPLGLQDFDFAITIDCSWSMAVELERVRHDLMVMFTAFTEVSKQPRLGITGFAPGGETRTFVKLTGRADELTSGVKALTMFGPTGEEEWAGGIEKTIKSNDWRPAHDRSRRVIVLITDEPITPAQLEKAQAIAKQAAPQGFRIYAVMVFPLLNEPDPFADPTERRMSFEERLALARRAQVPGTRAARIVEAVKNYQDLCAITGGQAIVAQVPQGLPGLGTLPSTVGPRRAPVAVDPNSIAPVYPNGGPTAHLLTVVLTDAISFQYSERVGPLVQILTAHSQRVAWVPEVRSK
jgi:hypothetical protein